MNSATLDITPRSGHIGAFVGGVDLAQPLNADMISAIRTALLNHCVLFFRDQHITPEQHIQFAEQFGEIEEPHPVFGHHQTDPRLAIIESKGRVGDEEHHWHTDVTYQEAPSMGSLLVARKLPDVGGDTLFASMYAAYDALSKPMQEFLCGLTATHTFESGWGRALRMHEGGDERMYELNKVFPPMSHPVVRTHPETGRKALFVNEYYTTHINELSEYESAGLMGLLNHHCQLPDFQIRHNWQVGDLAFWDNRCTQHYASCDYGAAHRIMNRVTVVGERPFYRA